MHPGSDDDPFARFDPAQRTFVRPNPGGRVPPPAAVPPSVPLENPADDAEALASVHGLNPLLAVANRLLMLVPSIRHTRHVADPAALRQSLAQGVREFEHEAQARSIAPERIMAARYILCTVLDEAAADTPWGGSGTWARHSLLAMFHNEVFGGEKVFQLMARLAEQPQANRDLLELIYAATCLGFEGRYRVIEGGRAQLEAVRERLAQILRQQRGPAPATLAEHWQGRPTPARTGLSWLPLALVCAIALLVLGGAYTAFLLALGSASDPAFARIQSLALKPPVAPVILPAPKPRLAHFLQAEIKAGLVAVRDEVDRSVVTLRGDGFFAPGSAALMREREEIMTRIADALVKNPGTVLVTGHTDNTPIRTARFPSNWHLSEERARSVARLLASGGVTAERLRVEGRAEGEPVVANDTPGNRALNRRVEVTLFVPAAPPVAQVVQPVRATAQDVGTPAPGKPLEPQR